MADAEQSQSRCLIWRTEAQLMNALQHNTHIWSWYSLRKQDKWILPSAQLRVMLISRHLTINSVNAINLGIKESCICADGGNISVDAITYRTALRHNITNEPRFSHFLEKCEWSELNNAKITAKMLVVSRGLLVTR